MKIKLPGHLLKTEDEQLKKLHEIVLNSIGEENRFLKEERSLKSRIQHSAAGWLIKWLRLAATGSLFLPLLFFMAFG